MVEVLECWHLDLSNHTIKCHVCQRNFNTFDMLWHIYHLMVWLESPESQLFKIFFQIENQLDINKVMSKNVMSPYSVFWVSLDTFDIHSITTLTVYFELLSTSLTYIAYNPYSVFELFSTPSTYIAFDQLFIVQYSISHLWHLCLIHLIYNVDSYSKYSNYMKIWLKFWITRNFKITVRITATLNYTPVKFPLDWWNFELTVFE